MDEIGDRLCLFLAVLLLYSELADFTLGRNEIRLGTQCVDYMYSLIAVSDSITETKIND